MRVLVFKFVQYQKFHNVPLNKYCVKCNLIILIFIQPAPHKAMEYLAGLPDYQPRPWDSYGFVKMDLSPESALKNVKPRVGRVGGSVSYPSKFVPGRIEHRGYNIGE